MEKLAAGHASPCFWALSCMTRGLEHIQGTRPDSSLPPHIASLQQTASLWSRATEWPVLRGTYLEKRLDGEQRSGWTHPIGSADSLPRGEVQLKRAGVGGPLQHEAVGWWVHGDGGSDGGRER